MSKTTSGVRKKPALGRGLGSLLGEPPSEKKQEPEALPILEDLNIAEDEALSEGFVEAPTRIKDENRVWQLPIEHLAGNDEQPRKHFDPEALKELSESIKVQGILQPIVARKNAENSYEIIAGERRWRAAGLAGLKEVPVILKDIGDQNSLELALIENIQRQDLNPIEEAEAYEILIESYGLTQQQVAEKVGKERATVANLIRLLNLVPELRKAVGEGRLAMGQAKVLLSLQDDALQKEIGLKVVRGQLTVKATEKLVQAAKKRLIQGEQDSQVEAVDVSAQLIKGLGEELQKVLGTKATIDYSKGRGKVSIHFYSDDELNSFVDKVRAAWQS